jgi:hypothetical protein
MNSPAFNLKFAFFQNFFTAYYLARETLNVPQVCRYSADTNLPELLQNESMMKIATAPFYRIGNCVLYGKNAPCEHSPHWDDALTRKVFICLR